MNVERLDAWEHFQEVRGVYPQAVRDNRQPGAVDAIDLIPQATYFRIQIGNAVLDLRDL